MLFRSSHTAGGGTNASHDLPMKPRPVGTWFRSPLAHFVMVSATEPGSVFDSPYGGVGDDCVDGFGGHGVHCFDAVAVVDGGQCVS